MNRAASMLTWMLLTHSAYASGVQPSQAPGALQAVFLDLLQQVDVFIEQQGEADFYTGPARAMRALLTGRKPAEHLQLGLDKFLAASSEGRQP